MSSRARESCAQRAVSVPWRHIFGGHELIAARGGNCEPSFVRCAPILGHLVCKFALWRMIERFIGRGRLELQLEVCACMICFSIHLGEGGEDISKDCTTNALRRIDLQKVSSRRPAKFGRIGSMLAAFALVLTILDNFANIGPTSPPAGQVNPRVCLKKAPAVCA